MARRSYRYCGLRLDSEWPLPLVEETAPAAADIAIRHTAVLTAREGARFHGAAHMTTDGALLWRLDGVGRYRVHEGGDRIDIDPEPDADPDAVTLMLLHPVFTLACMRRGDWLLSASAVAVDGRAVAFAGPTMSGKSTLAALLAGRGHGLLADGLLRLTVEPGGTVLAHPQAPWALLWPETLERLGRQGGREAGTPVRAGLALRRVPLPAQPEPLPLAGIGFLVPFGKVDDGTADMDLPASQGFARLRMVTAGGDLIRSVGDRVAHLHWGAALSNACTLETLALPWGWDRQDALLDRMERWLSGSGAPPR